MLDVRRLAEKRRMDLKSSVAIVHAPRQSATAGEAVPSHTVGLYSFGGCNARVFPAALGRFRGRLSIRIDLLPETWAARCNLASGLDKPAGTPAAESLTTSRRNLFWLTARYSSDDLLAPGRRSWLRPRGHLAPTHPHAAAGVGPRTYNQRNRIERCFNKLEHSRRFATRYWKPDRS